MCVCVSQVCAQCQTCVCVSQVCVQVEKTSMAMTRKIDSSSWDRDVRVCESGMRAVSDGRVCVRYACRWRRRTWRSPGR